MLWLAFWSLPAPATLSRHYVVAPWDSIISKTRTKLVQPESIAHSKHPSVQCGSKPTSSRLFWPSHPLMPSLRQPSEGVKA